jgi:hypothetical protein
MCARVEKSCEKGKILRAGDVPCAITVAEKQHKKVKQATK